MIQTECLNEVIADYKGWDDEHMLLLDTKARIRYYDEGSVEDVVFSLCSYKGVVLLQGRELSSHLPYELAT